MSFVKCGQCEGAGSVHVGVCNEAVRCGMCQGHGCVEVKGRPHREKHTEEPPLTPAEITATVACVVNPSSARLRLIRKLLVTP